VSCHESLPPSGRRRHVNEDVTKRMHVAGVAGDIATGTQSTAVIGVAAPEAARSGHGWVPCVHCRCRRATPVLPMPVAAPPLAQQCPPADPAGQRPGDGTHGWCWRMRHPPQ
jgi:hypothetical protein